MQTLLRVRVLNGGRHTHREETQCCSDFHKAHFLFPIKRQIQIMTEDKGSGKKKEEGRKGGCMRTLR